MTHDKVWLIIGYGMSERTLTSEVRGVYAHIADAHNVLGELRRIEPNTQFRVQAHYLIDMHCKPVPAGFHSPPMSSN